MPPSTTPDIRGEGAEAECICAGAIMRVEGRWRHIMTGSIYCYDHNDDCGCTAWPIAGAE